VTKLEVVADALRARRELDADAPLIKVGGGWVSSLVLDEESDRLAAGLAILGSTKGERIAWMLPNCPEVPGLLFAIAKLGAIQVPLNPYLKGEFLAYQLNDCGATVLVTDAAGMKSAAPRLSATGIKHLVLVGGTGEGLDVVPTLEFSELKLQGSEPPNVEVMASDTYSILYTSGTTGLPKGCMIPHGYYIEAGRAFSALMKPGDRVFTSFPLFHNGGQVAQLMGSVVNNAAVCFETEFSATAFMERAFEERATVVTGVGAIAMAVLARPVSAGEQDNDLRMAAFAPLVVEKQLEFARRFNCAVTSSGYGQTECNPITLKPNIPDEKRGTMGLPLPHLEVRIVDDFDNEVPTGTIGELIVRPRNPGTTTMFSGYWGKPEATLALWRNLWHHTGDYATMDDDGYVTFVDRKKDALRRRGENVSSFELEAAIAGHPFVAEVAVCAVPSSLGEDEIKACIVPIAGAEILPHELFDFLKLNVPYFAIPRYVQIRESLPMTAATHRVQKHVLRDEGITDDCWDFEELELRIDKADRRS
jgi:crotonobetaine/carnitine-CoA ligase